MSVNDKWHYCHNCEVLVGSRAMRDRHLRLLGYVILQVSYQSRLTATQCDTSFAVVSLGGHVWPSWSPGAVSGPAHLCDLKLLSCSPVLT